MVVNNNAIRLLIAEVVILYTALRAVNCCSPLPTNAAL